MTPEKNAAIVWFREHVEGQHVFHYKKLLAPTEIRHRYQIYFHGENISWTLANSLQDEYSNLHVYPILVDKIRSIETNTTMPNLIELLGIVVHGVSNAYYC